MSSTVTHPKYRHTVRRSSMRACIGLEISPTFVAVPVAPRILTSPLAACACKINPPLSWRAKASHTSSFVPYSNCVRIHCPRCILVACGQSLHCSRVPEAVLLSFSTFRVRCPSLEGLLAWVHGQWMSTLLGQQKTPAALSCHLPASAQDGPLDLRGRHSQVLRQGGLLVALLPPSIPPFLVSLENHLLVL